MNSKIIMLNYDVCHKSNVLFVAIVVQKSADDKQKKTKNIVKRIFDKQIEKEKKIFVRKRCALKNENR